MPGLKNLNVDVKEQQGNIVFLHKIVEGSASRSYGIHVADLAGVPREVLEMAADKLNELEAGQPAAEASMLRETAEKPAAPVSEQLSFFDFAPSPVVDRLRALNLMEITPSQAFAILEELKEAAK